MAHAEWDLVGNFFLDLFSSNGSSTEGLTDRHRVKDASGFECRKAGLPTGPRRRLSP